MSAQGKEQSGSRHAVKRIAVLVLALLLVAGVSVANSYGDSKQPVGPAASRMMSAGAAGSGLPASRGNAVAGGGGQGQVALSRPVVIHASHSDTSPPLRSIAPVAPARAPAREDRNE